MKNYTITVNGNVYEVTVEEGQGSTAAPAAKAAAPAAPKAAPAAPKAAAPAAAGAEGAVKVNAPMPGKILATKVSAGDTVTRGQVVVVLEAMKMENDIVAPQDGTVASVNVTTGQSVESGAVLVTMN